MADKQSPKLNQNGVADRSSMSAVVDFALKQFQLFESNQQLPARVIKYDREKNVATVQPLIMFTTTSGDPISRDQIVDVPTLSLGGGKFHISFPLKPGDLGWIVASDRDLSLFLQSLKESKAPTRRTHNFADSLFYPDVFRNYTVAGEDADAMVIQSTDGATKISIRADNILISTQKVLVRAPESEFTGNVTIDKNLVVTGTTNVNGGFTSAPGQPCTLPATTTVNNKQVDTHTHGPGTYKDSQGGSLTNNSGQF
ncbi:hypothetical protein BcepF1.099 [Burkholderia phage BcepF1]|uniref:Phage protein Gp138 N-terminal domain-containing protein n=1 Tax=Burkholderia phage BcepF1 TaxID=2886897 RepID=A1Z003_9CAUD|nr:baseplate spike [Burkholderia phage BcepF1]ABL96830.1 hypothetical protein BcepF1.099 [Burkholderia phage BcepF1]